MFNYTSKLENELTKDNRIHSIDIMRGVIMVLMVLDHCRDFFHIYAFDYSPEDLNFTTPIVFYTRWITHFCAPVFIFLTGVSAFLYGQRYNLTTKELANYLLVRGALLILLELTIVRFAWRFYIDYSSIGGLILWGIGWSMIAMAGIIYLKRKLILALSLMIIFFHNFLDSIIIKNNKVLEVIWSFFHNKSYIPISEEFGINILYPVLPMIGLIAFGYYIGKWFTNEYHKDIRSGYLFYVGVGMVSLFVSIRFFQLFTEQYSYILFLDVKDFPIDEITGKPRVEEWTVFFKEIGSYIIENYGDPSPWAVQENFTYSVISFLNTTKYPMSLLYILMTMGPAFIVLSLIEGKSNRFARVLETFGRVPLFFYIVHLFIIHALAILIAVLTNATQLKTVLKVDWKELAADYGYSMPVVYVITLFVVALLYPLCYYYGRLKSLRKGKIFNYL